MVIYCQEPPHGAELRNEPTRQTGEYSNARSGTDIWSLLRSWLRPHRGISQDKLPPYLGFFQFVHNARRRGKALLGALIAGLVA